MVKYHKLGLGESKILGDILFVEVDEIWGVSLLIYRK